MDPNNESISLALLEDAQLELRDALNSLGGKRSNGLADHFNGYSARLINNAAEGYIFLRESGRIDASKLLIRPAIEAMFRIVAIKNQPDLLYRIAYSEHLEDAKWARAAAAKLGKNIEPELKQRWQETSDAYRNAFPHHNLVEKKLTLRDAAAAAGIDSYYDTYYRLYCQFTHAAFSASSGSLDNFESHDSRTFAYCVLVGIGAAAAAGGESPNQQALWGRLFKL